MDTEKPKQELCEDQVTQLLTEAIRLRRVRSSVASATGFFMMMLIVYLFLDMRSFMKSYDTDAVVGAVQKELPRMLASDPVKAMTKDIQEKVFPAYFDEIKKKMTAAESDFNATCSTVLDTMVSEVGPAMLARVTVELADIMKETEDMVRVRYPDLKDKDIMLIMSTLERTVKEQYAERLQGQLVILFGDINRTLESIRNDPGYKEMATVDTSKLEKNLLTTSLELASYEIDPELGAVR